MRTGSLKSNAAYSVLYKIINSLFPLITSMYVGRVLLADGVGRCSASQNNVSYFVILASLGIPAYGIREIAKLKDNQKEKNNVFSELLVINAIFTTISLAIFFLCMYAMHLFENEQRLYLIYGILIVLNYANVDWLYQGVEEYRFIAFRGLLIKIVSLLLLLIFVRTSNDINQYAAISVLGTAGNNLLNLSQLRKHIKLDFSNLHLGKHVRPLVYLALCTISTQLYARMDITMLEIMKGNEYVGNYVYAHRIVDVAITFMTAITAVLLPRLSYYYTTNKSKANSLINSGFHIMFLLSVPACIGIASLAKPIISLMAGSSFTKAPSTLAILSLMIPFKCVGDVVCYQVMMCAGKEQILLRSYVITMAANFVNNMILIPRFGVEGAAIASVISEVITFVYVIRYSLKEFDFKPDRHSLLDIVLSCMLMFIWLFVIKALIRNEYLYLCIGIIGGATIYLFANLLVKNRIAFELIGKIHKK